MPLAKPTTRLLAASDRGLRTQRLGWAVLGAGCALVVLLAGALTPNPDGLGTHTQLGLPPCGFLYLTSLPCPGCGLTTSFAHMARLEITAAAHAHPLGVVLFMLTLLTIPLSLAGCVRGWVLSDTFARLRGQQVLVAVALLAASLWLVRVARILLAP